MFYTANDLIFAVQEESFWERLLKRVISSKTFLGVITSIIIVQITMSIIYDDSEIIKNGNYFAYLSMQFLIFFATNLIITAEEKILLTDFHSISSDLKEKRLKKLYFISNFIYFYAFSLSVRINSISNNKDISISSFLIVEIAVVLVVLIVNYYYKKDTIKQDFKNTIRDIVF